MSAFGVPHDYEEHQQQAKKAAKTGKKIYLTASKVSPGGAAKRHLVASIKEKMQVQGQ
jgi:hypothetical protein